MAAPSPVAQPLPAPPRPVYLAGPTASGKSDLALVLAERLGGEIITVDSMQVYRGLDIGTAKPSIDVRRRVPHHVVDHVALTEGYDAARFVRDASAAQRDVEARGRRAIFCGGTGLYFKALLCGLSSVPGAPPALRESIRASALAPLLAELAAADPEGFQRIDLNNRRRVERAVEILRLTGQPPAATRPAWSPSAQPSPILVLRRDLEDLRRRIDRRVDTLFAAGLVDETRALLNRGLRENPSALQAIGYRQVVEYLDGVRSLPDTIAEVKRRTRQFAKRQLTWFRLQLTPTWIDVGEAETPETLAARLCALL